jgi:CSLREA domain-containing protein
MPRILRWHIYVKPLLLVSLLLLLVILPGREDSLLDSFRSSAKTAATFTVNSTGDSADSNLGDGVCNDGTGACTLRAAISQANANASADVINFNLPANSIITLNNTLDLITDDLDINGPGANTLTIQRSTADGTPRFRIFLFDNRNKTIAVNISGLTISNGHPVDGANGADGGGISNFNANVNLTAMVITGNSTGNGISGGGGSGGGILNFGTMTITNSTISGNSTGSGIGDPAGVGGYGGGIFNTGTLTLINTTVSNNTTGEGVASGGYGGGIYNTINCSLTLINATVSGNQAASGGFGGGIRNDGSANIEDTIIANNTVSGAGSGPDLSGSFNSQDYNLIKDTSDASFTGTTTHHIIGVDPVLGPLAANGGPTFTHSLLFGSPAIDAGNSALTTDQRGQPRPIDDITVANASGGNASDIGAYEAHTLQVNSTSDSTDGSCAAIGTGNGCTLREAITAANAEAGAELINFAPALTSGGPATISLLTELPGLSSDMTIAGPAASLLTVERSHAGGTSDFRIFTINSGKSVTISNLTVSNGNAVGAFPANLGGDLLNDHGTLNINSCVIKNAIGGGAIDNFSGSLIVSDSSISGNNAGITNTVPVNNPGANPATVTVNNSAIFGNSGFAIDNSVIVGNAASPATVEINNSTISGNSIDNPGGGGAVRNGVGTGGIAVVTINNSTISGNTNASGTGAIYNAAVFNSSTNGTTARVTVNNSTIFGNSAGNAFGSAGGISNIVSSCSGCEASVRLGNTIVAGNFFNSGGASDIFGTVDLASSFNLIGTGGSGGLMNGINNNQVGVANPLLGPLANNGGPTLTHALLLGSPALDAGSDANLPADTFDLDGDGNTVEAIPYDQRGAGFNRIVDATDIDTTATVDVGAFEAQVTLEELTDKTINEDASLQFSFNVAGLIKSVTATSSNTGLVPNNPANIAISGSGSTRTLTINPAADQFGSSVITVTVNGNNAQNMSDTFLLTVNPVNDAPSFTTAGDQTVNNNAGLQTINNWATNISAGPANESGQTLSFSVTGNTNPALFAIAPSVSPAGTLTYQPAANAGGTATITIVLQDNGGTANGGNDTSPPQSFNITVNPVGGFIRFSSASFNTTESSGSTTITVERSGDTSRAVSIFYFTAPGSLSPSPCELANGIASPRCDFTTALGTLRFAAGETAKTFAVLISQDNYVEGPETITLGLSNPTNGAALGTPSAATLTIADDATEPSENPIDSADVFVRQHYHDFLNREPDAAGLAFWTNQITECQQPGATCNADVRRINVSAAFFLSIEFQETGYLVERLYKSAYGDVVGTSNFGPAHQLPVPVVRFHEFLPDTQQIGKGVVIGQPGAEQQLENNKVAFTQDFVSRLRFTTAYPTTMTPAQFVDALFANTGVTPSTVDRSAAINEFAGAGNTADTAARARALRRVAENSTFTQQEFNRAFVLMQYFGYLRRNPDETPDSDYSGYDFWLTKLNQFGGNFINAEMVKAFIVSGEYRQRFGP